MKRFSCARMLAVVGAVLLLAASAGCPEKEPDKPTGPPPGTVFRVLIVDDAVPADDLAALRAEWHDQSGWNLEIVEAERSTWRDQATAVDIAILPAPLLGGAIESDLVQPFPESFTESEAWSGMFDQLKTKVALWDGRPAAIPLSGPVFSCYVRKDVLDKLGLQPPRTWNEVAAVVVAFNKAKQQGAEGLPDYPIACPLAENWAGRWFLARSAAYVAHPDNFSAWIRFSDAEPLLETEACLITLQQLIAEVAKSPDQCLTMTPEDVRRAFWSGECLLAFTWPGVKSPAEQSAEESTETPAEEASDVVAELIDLPGAEIVYNANKKQWEPRGIRQVTLLGELGAVAALSASAKSPEAACRLIAWLASDARIDDITGKSLEGSPVRRSAKPGPGLWVEDEWAGQSFDYIAHLETAYRVDHPSVMTLRIPHRDEYLAALDEAVRAAVAGDLPPDAALRQAAETWRSITEQVDPARQSSAYMRSLGETH